MFTKQEVANHIKQMRELKDLSQQDLADASGEELAIIEGIESGKIDLGYQPITTALRIARALNTTVEEIFNIE